jgi:hypothetical protein
MTRELAGPLEAKKGQNILIAWSRKELLRRWKSKTLVSRIFPIVWIANLVVKGLTFDIRPVHIGCRVQRKSFVYGISMIGGLIGGYAFSFFNTERIKHKHTSIDAVTLPGAQTFLFVQGHGSSRRQFVIVVDIGNG